MTQKSNKTKPTIVSPAEFLASVENDKQRAEAHILLEMCERVTGESAKMWGASIIGCGHYHYVYDSGREGDFFLCGFSPRKANLVVYLVGEIPDQSKLLESLGKHKMGKSCLYIKRLSDIDLVVLEDLLNKSMHATQTKYPD